jgi:pimeloyl-ACP methyl ester carboxylesterase
MTTKQPSSSVLALKDGRALGFVEYGDPAGPVLIYLHGFPGSRLEARWLAKPAERAGVRLIGVDRPGIGLSDRKAGRRIADFPDDLAGFAEALGIDRYGIIGFSGGAPYALASAWKRPGQLTSCSIVSGAGPAGRFQSAVARFLPWIALPLIRRRFLTHENAIRTIRKFARRWPEADRSALRRTDIERSLTDSLVEAFRNGAAEVAYDAMLLGRPWGFRLQEIAFPNIHLWHGEQDTIVPISAGRAVAARLSGRPASILHNEGHISLIANYGDEIVTAGIVR